MTCELLYDDSGVLLAVACSAPWGIGTTKLSSKLAAEIGSATCYGFAAGYGNPHDFRPDTGACTESELAAWSEACAAWDEAQAGQ